MIEIQTPCRLHFGLLAVGPEQPRRFGGLGLMIRRPDVAIRVSERADRGAATFTGSGHMSDRAVAFARRFAERAVAGGLAPAVGGAHIEVLRVPRPHTGLGTGTQLGMAVGRALAGLLERDDLGAAELAGLVGRGQRSAVGAHGFMGGGLVLEGGKSDAGRLAPLVARIHFPDAWRIVLVRPRRLQGLAGEREREALAHMAPIDVAVTERMCRLILLGLAPAVLEQDLGAFGQCLFELQQLAGSCFQGTQGGLYADPLLEQVVHFIRAQGVGGVGQSSWGPTLYTFCGDDEQARHLADQLQGQFDLGLDEVLITSADNHGAVVRQPAMATGPAPC